MFEMLKGMFKRQREVVAVDDEGVVRRMANGQTESVRWDDLREVHVITTDQGPFLDDVFWLLIGDEGGCAVPSEAEGAAELLERLQQLPKFDNCAVIAAMGCTENNSFSVWHRRPEAA